MFKKSDFKKLKSQSSIVFNSKLLANLNPLERYELLQLCHRRNYKEGEFIYYQNDPGTGMYFIEEGSVDFLLQVIPKLTRMENILPISMHRLSLAPCRSGMKSRDLHPLNAFLTVPFLDFLNPISKH